MCTHKFVIMLHFLTNIMAVIGQLNMTFQADSIDPVFVANKVTYTIDLLTSQYVTPLNNVDDPTADVWSTFGRENGKLRGFMEEMHSGDMSKVLPGHEFHDDDDFLDVYSDSLGFMKDFTEQVITQLKDQFPDNDVLKLFGIFHPNRLPKKSVPHWGSYGDSQIAELIKLFGVDKTDKSGAVHEALIDPALLKEEWPEFKLFMDDDCRDFKRISDVTEAVVGNSTYASAFPTIMTLLLFFSVIPMSNAIVERIFSLMNHIKVKRRNRMVTFLLDMLCRVNLLFPCLHYIGIKKKKFREPDYNAFDWERAYTLWHAKCTRGGFHSMIDNMVDEDDEPLEDPAELSHE